MTPTDRAREEAVELARECVELGVALTPQTLALVLAELDQARADLAHARSAGRAYRDKRDRLRELVDQAAELLRSRLDEDEAIARDELDGVAWERITDVGDEYNYGQVIESPQGNPVAQCGVEGMDMGEVVAEHIARHDPARVLSDVEAVRVLLAELDRLRELVDLAAALKTVGGIRPGYQERGEWVRGTLPPPASATDGPAVVTNPERSEHA